MKKLNREFRLLVGKLDSRKRRIFVLALTIALFILAAAAPNATIAIGK